MYEPLQFIEQLNDYLVFPGDAKKGSVINTKAMEMLDKEVTNYRDRMISSYVEEADNVAHKRKFLNADNKNYWEESIIRFAEATGMAMEEIADYMDYAIYNHIRYEWGNNKIVYKVDEVLLQKLTEMVTPKTACINAFIKVPVKTFYIDFDGHSQFSNSNKHCGCFVTISVSDTSVSFVMDNIYSFNRIQHVLTRCKLTVEGLDETETLEDIACVETTTNFKYFESVNVTLENGDSVEFKEIKFVKFLYNFLVYLSAANKDIEISEVTKSVYKKPKKAPKNKFSEVLTYDVGVKYSTKLSSGVKKRYLTTVKDVDNDREKKTLKSHYRSAHWHHYWTGSGDNKELIVKWVDGVFVNGTDNKDLTIHSVS